MPVPDFQSVMLPLLKVAADGQEHSLSDAITHLADEFQLSDADRTELLPSGGQARFNNRVGWASTYLRKSGLLKLVRRGVFEITDRGREVLAGKPTAIDLKFLETRYLEVSAFRQEAPSGESAATFDMAEGTWTLRPEVERRVRDRIEHLVPDETTRRSALSLMAFAIENADEERGDAWYIRESSQGLRLMTGRLFAVEVTRSKLRVSVIGPISSEVRAALGAEAEDDEEFAKITGARLLTFPVSRATDALGLLKDGLNSFVDLALARVRSAVDLGLHVPEAVKYLSEIVGRELPQPEPWADVSKAEERAVAEDDAGAARTPKRRGRTPLFARGERSIGSLVADIERGVIALPDLQRPFVWENTTVRDLLDSLFLGFPVGTLVLWQTGDEKEARALGAERPNLRATTLVIDGQQRLTSLYAVMKGVKVVGKDGESRQIVIAFRPRDGRFEVADAAIAKDPEYLPNVTELWLGKKTKQEIRRGLMSALRDKGRAVDDAYEDAVEHNLEVAEAISKYLFPTVEICKTGHEEAKEEDVAEIFVRINGKGRHLGQGDFVLTLLSVYHPTLRDRIELRAREMSEGAVVAVDTQDLLRSACGVAFDRARMSAVYGYLRGVDPATGEASESRRKKTLDLLDVAADECIQTTPWRDYLLRVRHAGFVSPSLVASKSAIINAYALYMRGRRAGVPQGKLDGLISRWVFGTLLTSRYSGSSETIFEQDLARVAGADAETFVRVLDAALGTASTGDYWTRSLVDELDVQKSRSAPALAFRAAQVVLGARALFSDQLLQDFLDPPAAAARAASESHHLFPKAWLQRKSIDERRQQQVANLADISWHDNAEIGALGPAKYVPMIRERLGIDDNRWGRMCAEHALPIGWESLEYEDFLRKRRDRMAQVIRVAFRKLGGESDEPDLTPPWFLPGSEVVWASIAAAERALRGVVRDVYTGQFGEAAARKIEEALPEPERASLQRSLRARPAGADPLTVVDYLYLAQLAPLIFGEPVWQRARQRFGGAPDVKAKVQSAIGQIAPVRNEIAHVREVAPDRLQRANLACGDLLGLLRTP